MQSAFAVFPAKRLAIAHPLNDVQQLRRGGDEAGSSFTPAPRAHDGTSTIRPYDKSLVRVCVVKGEPPLAVARKKSQSVPPARSVSISSCSESADIAAAKASRYFCDGSILTASANKRA